LYPRELGIGIYASLLPEQEGEISVFPYSIFIGLKVEITIDDVNG